MSYASTPSLPNCYRVLNVSPGVNWVDVKKSYRALALKYHPDHHPDVEGYESRFKEISRAFKVLESHYLSTKIKDYECSIDGNIEDSLSDKIYDFDLDTRSSSQESFFKSILRSRFDKEHAINLKNELIQLLGHWEKKAFQLDVRKEVKIDSATVLKGGTVKIRQNKESFEVPIPQGAWSRMKIRISDKGEASWFRQKRGDLFLDIRVISSKNRAYTGDRDLYYAFPVSIEAIKKGKMQTLKTDQGIIKFILPRNTVNGQTFVLKARPSTEEALNTNHIIKIKLS